MKTLIREIVELVKIIQDFALATVISDKGSSPRAAGAKMLVHQDGSILGTVGGGQLEANVIVAAKEVIRSQSTIVKRFEFNGEDAADPRSLCGGRVDVLIEWIDVRDEKTIEIFNEIAAAYSAHQKAWLLTSFSNTQEKTEHALLYPGGELHGLLSKSFNTESLLSSCSRYPRLVQVDKQAYMVEPLGMDGTVFIFGAGHVGRSLAEFTHAVGFWTVILDDRPELNTRQFFPQADELILLGSFEQAFTGLQIDGDSFIVIVTRGHLFDQTVLAQALRTPAGYIGMIGSRRKCALIFEDLLKEGFTPEDIRRVHAPIGIAIHSETPAEIGVSIVAELIQARAAMR